MSAAPLLVSARSLRGLLADIRAVPAHLDRPVSALTADSREVGRGACFIALRGARSDGYAFLCDARARGAAAVLTDSPAAAEGVHGDTVVLAVPGLRRHAGTIAARFHGSPSAALTIIGITGTNGKTTVSQLIARALGALPARPPCGVIGTLGNGFPGALVPGGMTTPEPVVLQRTLAELRDAGARHVAIEVSSHALDQERVAGVAFDTAVFTNLTRDHLDYHRDLEAYAEAKARLFAWPGLRHAVLNLDDPFGRALADRLAPGARLWACTLADRPLPSAAMPVRATAVEERASGVRIAVATAAGTARIDSRLLGRLNAANLIAALGALLAVGVPLADACAALGVVEPLPGRLERFGGGDAPLVLIDYAHTPDALTQALAAARALATGRVWCVFGCGGDRDHGKRPQMGAVVAAHADRIVVTSDNPRSEDPLAILDDIDAGIDAPGRRRLEPDRACAIRLAVGDATPGDVVLVAGKGHEDYQQVGDRRLPFSDRAEVLAALRERAR